MHKWVRLFILVALFLNVQPVWAQADSPDQPIYIVQSGDSLSAIAVKFGLDVQELISANQLIDPDNLKVGDELIIPGLEGIRGVLVADKIPFGEDLTSIGRRYQVSLDLLSKLNHITSPSELYAGVSLLLPKQELNDLTNGQAILTPGQSLLELAVLADTDPWTFVYINSLQGTWDSYSGEKFYFPSDRDTPGSNPLHPALASIEVKPLPFIQGKTVVIHVKTNEPLSLGGSLAGQELRFFSEEDNSYVALQGVHAMANPGLYPLRLTGKTAAGSHFIFEQMVILESGYYQSESVRGVDPATLDPQATLPENDLILSLISPATPHRYWDGPFASPGYDPNWITSWFGTRRTYNNDPKTYFHTGLDYGGGTGLPLKAPAPGVIVYTGALTVRGNAIIVDHGWGVYSGFWHLSEIQVAVGDQIATGQQIGLVGGTGRVTGAHLHWEVWANGVQVEPLDWLENSYP